MSRIAIASDHAGLNLRELVGDQLRALGHEVEDLGPQTADSVDYPDYASPVAHKVAGGEADFGVLICGTGTGMAMTANGIKGVRAAVCTNELLARMAREHNDANVLCLGERITGAGLAASIVEAFFSSEFEGGRHQRRVDKIEQAKG